MTARTTVLVRATPLVALLLATLSASPTHAYDREYTEAEINRVSGVFEYWVYLRQGTNLIWTENLVAADQCTPDVVMHVRTQPLTGHPMLEASNDDCVGGWPATGLNPCIAIDNPESTSRLAKVIVHAYQTCSASTGTFRFVSSASNITATGTFGGYILTASQNQLGWSAGERVEVVRPVSSTPIGASYRVHAIRAPSGSCGYNDIQLADGTVSGSPGGGVSMAMDWSSASYCQVRLVVGHSSTLVSEHQARVYINDVANDTDGDGLGNLLEATLQTCASDPCPWSVNARDTDHDGLEDGWELLGVSGQKLPSWGAYPRHKDAFVELDWHSGSGGFTSNPWTPTLAVLASQPYSDGGDPASMDNPDGSPGLQVHFDIGVTACDSIGLYCSGTYGSWGGTAAYTGDPFDYEAARNAAMASVRRGLFFYGLAHNFGGGQGSRKKHAFRIGTPMTISPINIGRGVAHELGHLMRLEHYGDGDDVALDCKANYPSIMNYAYEFPYPYAFSDGARDTLNSTAVSEQTLGGNDPAILTAYFGLDIAGQTVDWNRDGAISSAPVKAVTRRGLASDNCDTGAVHMNEVFTDLSTDRTPALVEFQGVLHAFFVKDGDDLYHATFDSTLEPCVDDGDAPDCCPRGSNAINDCNVWSAPTLVPTGGDLTSSPTAVVVETNPPKIALAYSIGSGTGRQFRIRSLTTTGTFTSERGMALQPLNPTSPEEKQVDGVLVYRPYPVVPDSVRLQLYYLGSSNRVRQANLYETYETNGPVVIDRFVTESGSGAYVTSTYAVGATRYDRTYGSDSAYLVTVNGGNLALYLANDIEIVYPKPGVFAAVDTATRPVTGAPSIMHEHEITEGLEVFYNGSGTIRRTWATDALLPEFIFDRNIYGGAGNRVAAGLAVYQGHLQLGTSCGGCKSAPSPLQHQPFASGVFDVEETDNDDFATMADNLCSYLRDGAGPNVCQPCVAPGDPCPPLPLTPDPEVTCHL